MAVGGVSKAALEWSKGKPIEFYDGERFLDLWDQYQPKKTVEPQAKIGWSKGQGIISRWQKESKAIKWGVIGSLALIVMVLIIGLILRVAQTSTKTPTIQRIVLEWNDLTFTPERLEFRTHTGNRTPEQDIYLVIFGSLRNTSDNERCVYARDVFLRLDGESYEPNRDAMKDVQDALTQQLDYIGPNKGQCVDGQETEPTFVVFDAPFGAEVVRIGFFNRTATLNIDWPADQSEVIAPVFMFATPRLTNTRTPASTRTLPRTPTDTLTPSITPTPSDT